MRIAFIRFLIFVAAVCLAYGILVYVHEVKDNGILEMSTVWWNHPLVWMVSLGIGIFVALDYTETNPKK